MRRIAAWPAALLVLASCAAAFPADAAAPPKPTLAVELWPAEQAVNSSSYVQDIIFSGRIALGNAPYAKYEVFLRSRDNPGWATSCTPDYVTFWGAGSAEFNLTVRVPFSAANQTVKIWVESRATYEDVDVAGNVSAPVYVTVGPLPANTNLAQNGDPFFGGVSGGGPALAYAVVAAAVCLPAALVVMAIVWRRRRRGREVMEVTEDT